MVRIKYNFDVMQYMLMFERLTGAKLKDCILNDSLVFVVNENEMGKAIGTKGANIKRIEAAFKKKIKLVEFNPDVCKFVGNLIYPTKVNEIKEEDGIVGIHSDDKRTKGIIIGRDKVRINSINLIVKRYFPDKEVKVLQSYFEK